MQPLPITLADAQRKGRPYLSVVQSRRVDTIAIEQFRIPGKKLMANAGEACAQRILTLPDIHTKPTLILAGTGNNGGDGYVIAKAMHAVGCDVTVMSLVNTDRLRGDARWAWSEADHAGVAIASITTESQLVELIENHHGMIVDCMLGTGASGDPRPPMGTAITLCNRTKPRSGRNISRVAIDLPSGFCGNTGRLFQPHFQADLTLTFVAAKVGMRLTEDSDALGQVEIIDIGIPPKILDLVLAE